MKQIHSKMFTEQNNEKRHEIDYSMIDPEKLNEQQREVYLCVEKHLREQSKSESHEPLRMILQGRAGTGKSFLIRCLQKLLKELVRVGAFTAKAAYMIDGQTLHSLFKLNIDKENKTRLGPVRLSEL